MNDAWWIGLGLNGVTGAAFVTIGAMLAVQLTRKGQWRTNRIGAIFTGLVLACGFGHALRALILAGPSVGLFEAAGLASRVEFTDWHMWVADGLSALAGVFYVVARTRNRDLLQTTRAFEDYRSRRARAIKVHDSVVQHLVEARVALQAGERGRAEQALEESLDASNALISRVQGPSSSDVSGDADAEEVVRSEPADA